MISLSALFSQLDVLVVLPACAFIIWQVRGVVDEQKRQGKIQEKILNKLDHNDERMVESEKNIAVLQAKLK